MKRIILIVTLLLLLTGCTIKNEKYYESVANIVISFFNSRDYDESKIDKLDRDAVFALWTSITHENQTINLSEYVDVKMPSNEESNCEVSYATVKKVLDSYKNDSDVMEPRYISSCNGYYAVIYESDLYPDYEYTLKNPEHNYILVNKYTDSNIKHYIYKSTYNGKGLMLKLHLEGKQIIKIDTEYVNANDYIQN